MELKLNEWARENDSSLQNAVSPFYDVEAAEFLWGRNNNSLLVNLQKLVGGPNSFGMQVQLFFAVPSTSHINIIFAV